jgi:hypothetical protein
MVCSSVIEKLNLLAVKMVLKKEKEGGFLPLLVVTASLDNGGEVFGGGIS